MAKKHREIIKNVFICTKRKYSMKHLNKLLILIFFLAATIVKSQDFVRGNFFRLKKYSELNYIGRDSSFLFYLSSKQSKRKYLLMRFDQETLKLLSEQEIEFDDSYEMIVLSKLEGKRLLLKTETKRRKTALVEHTYYINCYTLDIMTANSNLGYVSPYMQAYQPADPPIKYHLMPRYDLYDQFFQRRLPVRAATTEELKLGNDFKVKLQAEPDTSIFYFGKFYSEFTVYEDNESPQVKKRLIDLGNGRKIIDYRSQTLSNGHIRIRGKYYERTNGAANYGLFQYILDKDLEEVVKPGFLPLIDGKLLNKDIKNHPDAKIIFGSFPDCVVETDHKNLIEIYNPIIVKNEMVSNSSYDGKQWHTSTSFVNVTHVGSIELIDFHPSGSIFRHTIYLEQQTRSQEKSVSFLCRIADKKLNFIFFDQAGNAAKSMDDKDVKTCYFNKTTALVRCAYDTDKHALGNKEIFLTRKNFLNFFDLNVYRSYIVESSPLNVVNKGPESKVFRLQKIRM
ncbi:MAG: hypothetical protein JWM28_3532 [Chitinophagaceae bacterium]|nr:hypothetical protein [Chitinophagaceae bacterium]